MAGASNERKASGTGAVSERRVANFRRLMSAQERIAAALTPHGLSDAQLEGALAACEEALPRDEHDDRDFYIPALELFVAALGGRLELQVEFLEVTVPLEHVGGPGDALA